MSNTGYEIVTERIIKELEKGNVPWRKPWSAAWAPKNAVSKRDYHGINYALLSCEVGRQECPYFATKRQIYKELGGKIKDDQWKQSQLVTFWKIMETAPDGEDAEELGTQGRGFHSSGTIECGIYRRQRGFPGQFPTKHQ